MPLPRPIFFQRAVFSALLASALLLTIRLGVAEVQFRRDPERAIQSPTWLRPESLVRPDASPERLRDALRLNPRLSLAWIYLGLSREDEAPDGVARAEEALLQAARVDRQYVPAWTLANFYFRHRAPEKFWPWAARAAALTFDDYRPLLRLADGLEPSARRVVARLPGGAPMLRSYMDLLIGEGRLEAANEISLLLEAYHDPSDQRRLEDLATRRRP